MELAGAEPSREMDGKSLVPLLEGEEVRLHDDRYLSFTCLGVNDIFDPYPIRGVVTERYKLIQYLNYEIDPPRGRGVGRRPEWELYDLANDPAESVNLAYNEKFMEIREDMMKRLEFWTVQVGDRGMETEYEAIDMFPESLGHMRKKMQ
jgi:arylsulfatase A-like enzyme